MPLKQQFEIVTAEADIVDEASKRKLMRLKKLSKNHVSYLSLSRAVDAAVVRGALLEGLPEKIETFHMTTDEKLKSKI